MRSICWRPDVYTAAIVPTTTMDIGAKRLYPCAKGVPDMSALIPFHRITPMRACSPKKYVARNATGHRARGPERHPPGHGKVDEHDGGPIKAHLRGQLRCDRNAQHRRHDHRAKVVGIRCIQDDAAQVDAQRSWFDRPW